MGDLMNNPCGSPRAYPRFGPCGQVKSIATSAKAARTVLAGQRQGFHSPLGSPVKGVHAYVLASYVAQQMP